jgi:predicted ATPase
MGFATSSSLKAISSTWHTLNAVSDAAFLRGQAENLAVSGSPPLRILLSYRRSDSAAITGRIFDRLAAHFGSNSVFMDIDTIPYGVDFHNYIDAALKTMDCVIAVIGPAWAGPVGDGTARIASPDDLVRIELETALRNGTRIVPVLVEGAKMPGRSELPESLGEIPSLNAAIVSAGVDFRAQVERLIRSLEGAPRARDAAEDFAPEPVLDNLPKRSDTLIGRATDLAAIESLLPKAGLLTITGTGGIGKTRVALKVASDLRSAYVDGVWFVDLAHLRTPNLVANEIASTLGVPQSPTSAVLATVIDYLRERDVLLVVDNCEHLIDEVAQTVAAILKACPTVQVLATSREQLGVEGEQAYRLPSLSVPSAGSELNSSNALDFAAVALFTHRAMSANSGFVLNDETASVIGDICRRLDGIALAIELAAARVDILSVSEIREHLRERFRILTDGRRTSVERQQTMRATIDWSYDLLSGPEQTLFRRLAIFSGGCTLESAEAICAFSKIKRSDVLISLASLVRKSLINADFQGSATRYCMLESTQAYASEKAASEWEKLSEKMSDWVATFTETAVEQGAKVSQQLWLASVQQEIDNVRFALEWLLASKDRVLVGARIIGLLATFWYDAGLQAEGQRWVDSALALVDEDADPSTAGLLWRAVALNANGNRAVVAAEKAAALLETAGSRVDIAHAQLTLAYSLMQVGRIGEADSAAERGLRLFEACDLQATREYADTLVTRAIIVRGLGLEADARRLFDSSLSIFAVIGDARGEASAKGNLAELEFAAGNTCQALQLTREAADAFHRMGATGREAAALVNAATYHLELKEIDQARCAAHDALRLARRAEDDLIAVVAIQNLACVKALTGEIAAAARLIGYVDEWYRKTGYEREWSEQRVSEIISVALTSASAAEIVALRSIGAALTEGDAVSAALTG